MDDLRLHPYLTLFAFIDVPSPCTPEFTLDSATWVSPRSQGVLLGACFNDINASTCTGGLQCIIQPLNNDITTVFLRPYQWRQAAIVSRPREHHSLAAMASTLHMEDP